MSPRILLTGGGTGGSVSPLLAVAEHLRQRDSGIEFLFIGSNTGPEASLCEAAGIPFRSVPSGKLRRYWSWKNITDLGNLWSGWLAAKRIVKEWSPDVVVAAGSFVAVPVVWAAHRGGSRIIIHQQDVRPGLANKLMTKAADRITVSFKKSLKDFPRHKVHLVGNPVREEIFRGSKTEAIKIFSLLPDLPTLLVVGGGTGSAGLNEVISAAASRIIEKWQIIHLAGQRPIANAVQSERYHQRDFLTWEYPHALAAADLVITRAGLGAISELAAVGKPAIFVPLPETHQVENATMISERGAGLVVPQDELTAKHLLDLLNTFLHKPELGRQWSGSIRRLANPKALATMGDLVLKLLNNEPR